jgi:membrane associated rhomboid family serine protease
MNQEKLEKKKLLYSLLFPGLFVLLLWIIKIIELTLDVSFVDYGLYPLRPEKLYGIITSPLIHSDLSHLLANTIPILILGTGIFYFYKSISLKVVILIYLISGIWLWFGGRPAYHIGASGIIYGFASFLFISGIIRKYIPLMAISLLVAFLYGGLIWGVLPIDMKISWEGHLYGGIAGIVVAFYYKNKGPQRKKYDWEIEEEYEEEGIDDEYDLMIKYHFENKKRNEKDS